VRNHTYHPEVELRGDIDLTNVDEIAEEISATVENRALVLILDLSRLGYVDSTGVRMLFRLARQLRERQQQLILVVPPNARFRIVLHLSAIEMVATVEPTVEAARSRVDDQETIETE
jgi:anti-sigma B factor antagonist